MKKELLFEFTPFLFRKLNSKILLLFFFLFFSIHNSFAQYTWVGGTSTDFLDTANWTPAPGFTATATFTIGAGNTNNPILGSAGYPRTSGAPTIGGIYISNLGNLTLSGSATVNGSSSYWDGIFTVNGGATNVRGTLYMGSNTTAGSVIATGNIETGGSFNVKNSLIVGNKQVGVLNVNGGDVTTDSTGFIRIGDYTAYAAGYGYLNLNSGSVTARANTLTIGTKGTVNVSGGSFNINAGNTNIANILNINGGNVNLLVGTNTINSSGTNTSGVINIGGGTLDIAGPLTIGAGTININSGLMNFSAVGALTINGSSIINIDGGSIVLMGDQTTAISTYITNNVIKLSAAAVTAGKILTNTYDAGTGKTTVKAIAPNTAPVAVADAITVAEGGTATTITGGATNVLTNDTDSENNTLTATVVANPTNGTLTLNSDGTFSYVHDGSETTSDSFTYKANDGSLDSSVVTVTITVTAVNDAPVAVAEVISVAEGGTATTLVGGATNVLTNDTDAENNSLTATVVANPTNGTLTLNSDGTFSYVHDGSETTSDSFTYKANDGTLNSNSVTVSITVLSVNDNPVAVTEVASVAAAGTTTSLIGGATSVLANDTDVENNILTAVLVSGPINGSLILNSNGTFSYVHDGSATTTDSFTYKANDGTADGNTITVSITISSAPAPTNLSYTTPNMFTIGTAVTALTPTVSGGAVVSYGVSPAFPSGLSLNTSTGIISGIPTVVAAAANYIVTATNTGGNTTAIVSITVNDIAPASLSYTTPNVFTKGTAITALNPTVSGGAVVSYSVSPALPSGLILNTTTGVISGTPTVIAATANYVVTATNTGGSTIATVSIKVNDIAPASLSYTTPNVFTKGTAITALNPTVGGGVVVSYSVSPALPSGLSLNTTTGVISGAPTVIAPTANYVVTANNTGGSATATVSIRVNDIAPASLSYTTPNVFTKGTAITALNPTVGGGAVVSYSVSPSLPSGLSLNTTTGVISGTPTAITAIANYTVTATNTGGSTTATVLIRVNDIAPSGLSYTTPNVFTKGTAITALNPTVGGGAVVSYSVSPALPSGLSLDTTTGVISGTPTAITAVANYTVTATNTGGSTTATVSITVNDVVPSGLSYTTPNVFTKGIAITALNPTVGAGTILNYSVSPSLPSGLSLNTTTGVISGTPTAITAIADYTLTATNAVGSTTATVSIKVNDEAPVGLAYSASNVFKKDRIVSPLSPSVSGGAVVSYSISPSLLAGLSFDTTTGVISGTPTVVSHERDYVVTATNTGGSTSFTLSIQVLDISLKVGEAFTPNGDGVNDYWIVPNVVEYPNSIVRVFNANGVQVFHSNNYQNNWDGRNENNNQELPVGSYLYQIDLSGDGTIDTQGWLYMTK